jgi:hypothetical protein
MFGAGTIARPPSRVNDAAMDNAQVAEWFAGYLDSFAALGRGEVADVSRILEHYGVPLMVSTDGECLVLTDEAQVKALAEQQFESLRADGYDHSKVLEAESTILNQSCAMHYGRFARVRADGSEMSCIESTYLIVDGPAGPRISVLVRHTPT